MNMLQSLDTVVGLFSNQSYSILAGYVVGAVKSAHINKFRAAVHSYSFTSFHQLTARKSGQLLARRRNLNVDDLGGRSFGLCLFGKFIVHAYCLTIIKKCEIFFGWHGDLIAENNFVNELLKVRVFSFPSLRMLKTFELAQGIPIVF